MTLVDLARNFGEHNAVMAGLRHARGAHVITMDDDLQNPPEEVAAPARPTPSGAAARSIYTYYDEKQHAAGATSAAGSPTGSPRFVLDKPKGLYLSSFRCMSAFVVREVTRYDGPFPYVDGLILQVTQNIDRHLVRHLPRAVGRSNYTLRRLLRLWTEHVRQFLGDAAAGEHADRVRAEPRRRGSARSAAIIDALFIDDAAGLGVADRRRCCCCRACS